METDFDSVMTTTWLNTTLMSFWVNQPWAYIKVHFYRKWELSLAGFKPVRFKRNRFWLWRSLGYLTFGRFRTHTDRFRFCCIDCLAKTSEMHFQWTHSEVKPQGTKVQCMTKVLMQTRNDEYKNNLILLKGLDLVEEKEQITHQTFQFDSNDLKKFWDKAEVFRQ